jgi:DNA-binding IclR family transcriptional regulator
MKESDAAPSAGANGVLGRAIELIELIAAENNGLGVREAARLSGVDRSAVSRILGQLEKAGYVEQDQVRKHFFPGPKLFSLAASLVEHDNLWKAAEPFLTELVRNYNETCYLSVRAQDKLVFRGKVDCNHTIKYVIELGKPFPCTSGAAGTAILSGMSEEDSNEILNKGFAQYTELSFSSAEEYQEQLRADRMLGYSYSPGRWVKGGSGVASPYFNAAGDCLGSITLSCPSDRLEGISIAEAGASVRQAAHGLSRRLGFLGEWEGWADMNRENPRID